MGTVSRGVVNGSIVRSTGVRIAIFLALAAIASKADTPGKFPVVVVIHDLKYLRQVLGDGAFVANEKDCYDARADLPRFMSARLKQAKRDPEAYRWREVLANVPVYIWHCGGVVTGGKKYIHATFSRYEKGLEQELFPDVDDGGTDFCEGRYDLQLRQLVRATCNSDA
jgi:hypothetical protein